MRITLTQPAELQHDTDTRSLTGIILPIGVIAAHTSAGMPVRVQAGALHAPDDVRRVKLLIDHDHTQPIGWATAITSDQDAIRAEFSLPDTTRTNAALDDIKAGLRDGLSVGMSVTASTTIEVDGSDILEITAAELHEVSVCAIPAFPDARITNVTATQETTMDPINQTTPDPDKATPPPTTTAPIAASHAPLAFTAPRSIDPQAQFDNLAKIIASVATASQITAALTDITPAADAGQGILTPQLTGELWKAVSTEIPYKSFAATVKPLTSGLKISGWAWKTRPTVADYAGNKTEIPSSPAATELVETNVTRFAGGHDVDRIFVDLADGTMLRALVEMMIADAADKVNAAIRAAITAKATSLSAGTTLPIVLRNVAQQASINGSRIDWFAMAPDVWAGLSDLTTDAVPYWMTTGDGISLGAQTGTIGGIKVWIDPNLSAGNWLAGDKRAMNYWSKEPPVRVQALDIPRGGIDIAVFGYHALLAHEPKALFKGTIAGG